MRIGVMLRAIEEKGGIGVYARNVTAELLNLDSKNEYFLYYQNDSNLGLFENRQNVIERSIRVANKGIWDQVAIPLAAWKDQIDVLFHPKFTVPLLAPCKTVMVLHGAGWFIPEFRHFWGKLDRAYIRSVMPVYCRRASAVVSISKITTDIFNSLFKLPEGKIRTIYFAPASYFRKVTIPSLLQEVRTRVGLPERFILTLTKRGGDKRKNLGTILEGYGHYHRAQHSPIPLVVAGKDCQSLREEYSLDQRDYGQDVLFPGWIDQEDLPAVYSLASLFLYPSNLEAFPVPITEALACETPIVTTDANGLKEIAGDAAQLVQGDDAQEIGVAVADLLSDPDLRSELSRRALARSEMFRWEESAGRILRLFEELGQSCGHLNSQNTVEKRVSGL